MAARQEKLNRSVGMQVKTLELQVFQLQNCRKLILVALFGPAGSCRPDRRLTGS